VKLSHPIRGYWAGPIPPPIRTRYVRSRASGCSAYPACALCFPAQKKHCVAILWAGTLQTMTFSNQMLTELYTIIDQPEAALRKRQAFPAGVRVPFSTGKGKPFGGARTLLLPVGRLHSNNAIACLYLGACPTHSLVHAFQLRADVSIQVRLAAAHSPPQCNVVLLCDTSGGNDCNSDP
jgi:hypothetical protein